MSKASQERRAARRRGLGVAPIDPTAEGARASMDLMMYVNAGMDLLQQEDNFRAEQFFRKALDVMPTRPAAPRIRAAILHNLGLVLLAQRLYVESMDCFERARMLDPSLTNVRDAMLLPLLYTDKMSPKELAREHAKAGARAEAKAAAQPGSGRTWSGTRDPDRKLRVGFMSGDFYAHAVMQFFEPSFLARYDRERFEVFLYSELNKPTADTVRIRRMADAWRVTVGQSDVEVAEQIIADEIDILIDLAGYTGRNRLGVFARKPAPVSASWIGYAHSTGMPSIGWRVVDAVTDPVGTEHLNAEGQGLLRLPHGFSCWKPPEVSPGVVSPPSTSGAPVTFGSFNVTQKLSPSTMRTWGRILQAVPGSRLAIKAIGLEDPRARESLLALARESKIDVDRLDILPPVPDYQEHLACYGKIDIALDPFPYTGTTTSCEAMWMGVPVITLRGNRHSARVGASLLGRVGLDSLIAEDRDDYVRRAAGLAANRDRLVEIRHTLRDVMRTSPLCASGPFTRDVEAGLRDIWRQWCQKGAAQCA